MVILVPCKIIVIPSCPGNCATLIPGYPGELFYYRWLAQFGNPGTGVIFPGHSMGETRGAGVALPRDYRRGFGDRINGAVMFHSLFLRTQSGVISAIIGRLRSMLLSEGGPAECGSGGGGLSEGEGVSAGVNSGTASVSTLNSGRTLDEFFDRRPERSFTAFRVSRICATGGLRYQ